MRHFLTIFLFFLLSFFPRDARAQRPGHGRAHTDFLYESVDPQADKEALEKMRAKMAKIRKTRPTVALVLSGGGAKGAAHVGVMRYLEEAGIPVDMIAGTSMGGLMGGLYSLGYPASFIDSLLRSIDWNLVMSDAVPKSSRSYTNRRRSDRYALNIPFDYGRQLWTAEAGRNELLSLPEGLLYGYNVENLISSLTVGYQDSLDFADLPIPFFCVSSDLASLKEYNWTRGSIIDAMRSTMSIPFLFRPVRTKGMVLTDGGTRNNFPVDIARAMGADYVIGVNLHVSKDYSEISGMGSFVSQLIDLTGVDTYTRNVRGVDVLIEPDLSGFNMMSFDKESIATLIQNGYRSADDHGGELAEIKARLRSAEGTVLAAPPATDISSRPVQVESIIIEGVTPQEAAFFKDKMHLKAGKSYTRQDIEEELSFFYASGVFSDVSYRLLGSSEPYRLVLTCKRGPAHLVSAGARFDTEELAAVILNVGLNANRLSGSSYSLTARLGNNPKLTVGYSYTPTSGYMIGADLTTAYTAVGMKSIMEDELVRPRFQMWHNSVRVYGSNTSWIRGTSSVGLEYENVPYLRILGGGATEPERASERFALSGFYNFVYDTMDDRYNPESGIRFSGRARYLFSGSTAGESLDPYLSASISFLAARRIGDRFTLLPFLNYSFRTRENCFIRHGNYLGGVFPYRHFENQLPFMGYNGVFAAGSNLALADLDLRYKIAPKDYITASLGSYMTGGSFSALTSSTPVVGIGLQYSHSTAFGPLKANIHWSSDTAAVGIYLSAGFDF